MSDDPETTKQRKFINVVASELGLERPAVMTKTQAIEWLHEHVEAFYKHKQQREWNAMLRDLDKHQRYDYL